jgi:hypothetical protein
MKTLAITLFIISTALFGMLCKPIAHNEISFFWMMFPIFAMAALGGAIQALFEKEVYKKPNSDPYGGRVWIDRKFFDNIIEHSGKPASAGGRTLDGHDVWSPDCVCKPKFEIDLFLNVGIWHNELPKSLKKF